MTSISNVDLSQSRTLNAKRYGLSQDDLKSFTDIMTGLRDKDGSVQSVPVQETDAERNARVGDYIKNYLIDRITGQLSPFASTMGVGANSAADLAASLKTGLPPGLTKSPQDMMFDMMRPQDQAKGSDWGGFLNLSFDYATLQMLNKS